jgi:hypothetical protein
VAPGTTKGTTLQKYRRADPGSVMDSKTFDIENCQHKSANAWLNN